MTPALYLLQTPADQVSSLNRQVMDYLQLILVLGAVLLLAYLTLRFWLPRMAGLPRASSGPIQVVARLGLEPRKSLYVIKTGAEFFLIGTSESEIHYLTGLDPAGIEPLLAQAPEKRQTGSEFLKVLKGLRNRGGA